MAKLLKLRRGTTSQHSSFTGAEGEVTVDTDKETLVVHDGSTAGGHPVAAEDMANVSAANIKGRLGTTLTNAEINGSAAIAGTKISPDFGSQTITTTGNLNAGDVTLSDESPSIAFTDSNNNSDFKVIVNDGKIKIQDTTNSNAVRFFIDSNGTVDVAGNLDVGSGVDVTGAITATTNITANGDIFVSSAYPRIHLTDTNNNSDYLFVNDNGNFRIFDDTNSAARLSIDAGGTTNIAGNLDVGAGVDVTGAITSTGAITITNEEPKISLVDSGHNPDFEILNTNGTFKIKDATNGLDRFKVNSDGHVDIQSNLDVGAGLDVTGNITATGTASTGQITAKTAQEPQIIVQDSDSGNTGNAAETGISFRDGGGTQQGMIGFSNSGDQDLYVDTASTGNRINFRVGGTTTQLEIPSGGINVTGNIAVTGTVDGRDVAADGSKLDNIESGATADQSGSEIATALRGQTIGTTSDGIHATYCDDWFRNNNVNTGLYNQSTSQHWYSEDGTYWTVAGGSNNGIKFRQGHQGTTRGAVYCNSSNQIGFLSNGLNWTLKVDSSGNTECFGNLTVNSGDNSSDIYMADADETTRRIHCNSHNIGFLKSDNNWGCYADNSGNWTAAGNVTAYSDARLKTNVNTINDALSIVGKLRGVSFDWKADGKHSIGVIAQEVEEVLPELVTTNKGVNPATQEIEEIKSVDYGKMVGVLINAINELKAEIEELKGGK